MEQQKPPASVETIFQILLGKTTSAALSTAAHFGFADALKEATRSAEDISKETGTHPDATLRVLRALAAVGVFEQVSETTFRNNGPSNLLRSDQRDSMRAMARWIGAEPSWRAWAHMHHSVRTGKPAFEDVYGEGVFEYFKKDKETSAVFNEAMTNFSRESAKAIVEAYDFTQCQTVVDVGGGHGYLMRQVISSNPSLKGVLYDLPEVIEGAREHIASLHEQVTLESGSFFEGVPKGADTYMMKHIIHDWDDERCIHILNHCREAMLPNGRVLVFEQMLDTTKGSVSAQLLDLEMLVMTPGGRERSEAEFRRLFEKSGLYFSKTIPTKSPIKIIEATKA